MTDTNPAPAATETSTEPLTQADLAKEIETLKAKNDRLLKDVQTHRTRADELKAAQAEAEAKALAEKGLSEQVEVLKARLSEQETAAQAAAARATAAERKAALTGRVVDPEAALKLLTDKHLSEDGSVNVDALLGDYAFLAPSKGSQPATSGAGGVLPSKHVAVAALTEELSAARTRQDRIRIQRQIREAQKG